MSRIVPRLLLAGVLLAIAGPVLALGLGRIEVRSQQGQPLLAEIPVVSSDPAELRQLQARLASPETFARIGLEPPRGLVSDLQFSVALDPRGRPVIRVTSAAPVEQEALTFLVEVDWGQGRLVREYSALVAVPDTLAAPAQPSIQAPAAASSSTIVRAPDVATPAPAAQPPAETRTAAGDAIATQAPSAPAARPASAQAVVGGELAPVQAGQTLSAIAAPLASEAGISVNQAMLLLLRANPEAFIGGNLNLVRQGAVLRMPARDEWTEFSVAEANAVVREQVAQWREMRRPAPQPEAPASEVAAAGEAAASGAAAGSQARLEITPPSGDGQQAGTQSGIDAGGGGDMLRQELQQANESLAARSAEVDELKARLADLEQLQQQQAQLIELKDAELAAAQQRMEASNQQQASAAGGLPWMWLGLALLIVAALAFVFARRARTPLAAPTRRFDSAALAAGMPAAGGPSTPADASEVPPAPAETSTAPAPAVRPTWHAGAGAATLTAPVPPPALVDRAPDASAPVTPARIEPSPVTRDAAADPVVEASVFEAPASDDDVAEPDTSDAAVELPAGVERLELARAYLELGDRETARSLLQEVAQGDDPVAGGEAARLLRTLD